MLKRCLLSASVLFAVTSVAAAADVSSYSNPFNGFYLGAHAGYGWSDTTVDYDWSTSYLGGTSGDGSESETGDGALLGAQMGYNHVLESGLLVGAEVSGSWTGITTEKVVSYEFGDCETKGVCFDGAYKGNIDALGLAQVKLGWANETFAVYGLGGLALAKSNHSVAYDLYSSSPIAAGKWNDDLTQSGWTLGAGLDMMLTDKVSLGATYNFVSLNGEKQYDVISSNGIVPFSAGVTRDTSMDIHVVRASLNYHFN